MVRYMKNWKLMRNNKKKTNKIPKIVFYNLYGCFYFLLNILGLDANNILPTPSRI